MKPRHHAHQHTGAALLMAMLSVALLTILASAALWQQWRTLSVESAERDAQQTAWLLRSAQDWALVVLREDGRSDSIDHLAEPWAVPLSEARLSAFLAASSDGISGADRPRDFRWTATAAKASILPADSRATDIPKAAIQL